MNKLFTILFLCLYSAHSLHSQDISVKLESLGTPGWPFVYAFEIDAEGTMYAGDERGFLFTKKKSASTWVKDENFDFGFTNIRDIAVFAKDDIWVCTSGKGLIHFDGTKWTDFTKANGLPIDGQWNECVRDGKGDYWFASRDAGIAVLSGSKWSYFDITNSNLNINAIEGLVAAKDGSVWVASYPDVINIKNNIFTRYRLTDLFGINPIVVSSLYEDPAGNIWACTGKGLFAFESNKWVSKQSISSQDVQVMTFDKNGTLWFMEYDNGIVRYTPSSKKSFPGSITNSLPSQAWELRVNDKNEKLLFGNKGFNLIIVNDDALSTSTTSPEIHSISLYPNPTSSYLHIDGVATKYTYSIYDNIGKLVSTGETADNKINVSKISAGSYMVKLVGDGMEFGGRMVKI